MVFPPGGSAAIASLLAACTLASAQNVAPVPAAGAAPAQSEWKLSTALGPAYAQGKAGERWAAFIRERSGGRLAVRHYPGATLFQRDPSREFVALREGSITFAVGSTLAWSRDVPALNLIALPWLSPSERALDALLDSAVGAELAARLETLGAVVVAWASNGFIEIASKRALRTPADFAGLRVRTSQTGAAGPDAGAAGRNHRGDARRRCEGRGARRQHRRRRDDPQRIPRLARGSRRLFASAIMGSAWSAH